MKPVICYPVSGRLVKELTEDINEYDIYNMDLGYKDGAIILKIYDDEGNIYFYDHIGASDIIKAVALNRDTDNDIFDMF
jgi:hypothetical protein